MTDLDTRIEALFAELIGAAPEPPPLPSLEGGGTWRDNLLVAAGALALVLVVGIIGALVGRNILPSSGPQPSLGPEPAFDPGRLGREQPLVPVEAPRGPEPVPDPTEPVTTIGRIADTDFVIQTFPTHFDGLDHECLLVRKGGEPHHQWCSDTLGPEADVSSVLGFPVFEEGRISGYVILWEVPESTSLVALRGPERLWQRPVEGMVGFWIDQGAPVRIRLEALDPDGDLLVPAPLDLNSFFSQDADQSTRVAELQQTREEVARQVERARVPRRNRREDGRARRGVE